MIIKNVILGTSDAWLISHLSDLSQGLYCRLSDLWFASPLLLSSSHQILSAVSKKIPIYQLKVNKIR